jgi:hypothetical protein
MHMDSMSQAPDSQGTNAAKPIRRRENRDWSKLIDQPMARGPKMKTWSRAFQDIWIEVRQGSLVVAQGVLNGGARTVQTQAAPEDAEVWGTFEAAGESLDIQVGQELVLTGKLGDASCRFTAVHAPRQDTGFALRRNSMPAQDPVKQVLSREIKEANLDRIKRGELYAADVLLRLDDLKPGPYMMGGLHAPICEWPLERSTGRFYCGDKPLYPGPCPEAQEAVDALNAQTTTDGRRREFAKLPPEAQTILTAQFGRNSPPYNLAKTRRGDFHTQLRHVQALTHSNDHRGKNRLRVYEEKDRDSRPSWLKAWVNAQPRYDRLGAVYVIEERP